MTSAIFGLVGVVVGAFLSAALAYVFERRREHATMRADTRLLYYDLRRVRAYVGAALTQGFWLANAQDPWVLQSWNDARGRLAAQLDEPHWEAVSIAVFRIQLLSLRYPEKAVEGDADRMALAEALEEIQKALEALATYVPHPYLWMPPEVARAMHAQREKATSADS